MRKRKKGAVLSIAAFVLDRRGGDILCIDV